MFKSASEKPRQVAVDGKLKKLAVLPFENITQRREAGGIISDICVSELFNSGRYRVEDPGNIRQFAIQEKLKKSGEMELNDIRVLGRRLKVDGVLVGMVKEFDDRGAVPTVAISARIIESESGRVVWSGEQKRRGDDYTIVFELGTVRSSSALAKKVAQEMIASIKW